MKLSHAFFSMILILVTLSAYQSIEGKNVNLIGLADKDFNYIVKFDKETTADEIKKASMFLNQYNSSIKFNRSKDEITGDVSFEIISKTVICRSSNFEYALILLDKDNQCQCAIGDKR